MVPDNVDEYHLTTVLVNLSGRCNQRFDNDDPRRLWRCFQIVSQLADTASDQDPDVGLIPVEFPRRDRVRNMPGQLVVRKWNRQVNQPRGIAQPLHMSIEKK